MKYTDTISNRKLRSELYAKSGSLVGSASITENLTVCGTLTTKDINVNSALITAGSVDVTGVIIFSDLPPDDPGVTGQIWNNSGVLNISA
jgi:hypothetical protein